MEAIMTKTFSTIEIQALQKSSYVEKVTSTKIIYGKRFEEEYHELIQRGYSPRDSFKYLGLDPDIVGVKRINKYYQSYKTKENTKLYQGLSTEELHQKLKEKNQEIELLKQERDFLLKQDQLMDQFKPKKK